MNERDENAVKAAIKALEEGEQRALVKAAIKELLAEYVAKFGWWSSRTLGLLAIGALVLFILRVQGWVQS